ncbi:hypothetical protein L202_06091 [Cryptococcus amylolentus CBS 6039]|uniref:Fork-head domain-containing protein n=1 Tax=Cryptococcus amylolentus CBS 6039 TaxID=1295533 RepID=A0A1E3HIJ1_9TREE|nr:hypothetical protein L202_06091 [Cryptococcus amylolentus CBS 6039]ODN76172.1 hypothetical protein L202_06091 [Cryptococcus amylolentus CBS 6039]
MSRRASTDSQHHTLASSQGPIQGDIMSDPYLTTPTSANYATPQIYYTDPYAGTYYQQQPSYAGDMPEHMISPFGSHQVAQGRVVMPAHGQPMRSPSGYEEYEFSVVPPEEEGGPYLQVPVERYNGPNIGYHTHPLSPSDQMSMEQVHQLQRSHSMPHMNDAPHPFPIQTGLPQRPKLQSSQSTMMVQQRPTLETQMQRPGMTRHASLARGSPYGDVFDHPGPAEEMPVYHAMPQQDQSWELAAYDTVYADGQGISPARALGPAPMQPQRFSPHRDSLLVTPQGKQTNYAEQVPSSAVSTATAASTSSNYSIGLRPAHRGAEFDSSDDEMDGRTRRPLPTRTMKTRQNDKAPPIPLVLPKAPPRPPAAGAGRTSSKFAKVAEDPGVEGIPPGPRSHERPGPSFACIIGQAILSCKAGGLSLEHIYRYVETAYPFFKSGDNAWRNSVRHNLSIHKMFETIPRTEKFPPGKGGIWIIHEDEKCHWPEPDKFIKNFPPGHAHHAVCRQTLHERQKEKEAMEKAQREGRVYVPKKGKKRRKGIDMDVLVEVKKMSTPEPVASSSAQIEEEDEDEEKTPPPVGRLAAMAGEDVDDEPEQKPEQKSIPERPKSTVNDENSVKWALPPPPVDPKGKRRQISEEDLTSAKRVRLAEPLAPIHPFPQERIEKLDSSFITPERERPIPGGSRLMSSDFKTPALVQSSSSPGSPPMPATVTRSTHHPSALQQAWTHDDMSQTPPRDSSPARPMLDAAFDLKPKAIRPKVVTAQEEDFAVPNSPPQPRAPPKTPVTRSSAAADKTPRLQHRKTPGMSTPVIYRGSPGMPPPTASALLSTPMWEIGGCLDRLRESFQPSPTGFGSMDGRGPIRSPAPPTSPTRYSMMLLDSGSPRKGRGT